MTAPSAFTTLLSPLRLGTHTVRNRTLMGSMHTGLDGLERGVERLAAFYAERARGGAALIVTGGYGEQVDVLRSLSNVEVIGHQDDMRAVWARVRAAVNPRAFPDGFAYLAALEGAAKAQASDYVKRYEATHGAGTASAFGAYTWQDPAADVSQLPWPIIDRILDERRRRKLPVLARWQRDGRRA